MKVEDLCSRPIDNPLLSAALEKRKARIFMSDQIKIPMATFSNAIFIPKEIIDHFPQSEFEAIVAHELEHVLWKDPIVRLFSQLISALFWWVPTSSWQKRLELDQEIACDQSILKYGYDEEFLASALLKVATTTREKSHETLCYLSNGKHPLLKRLQLLLGRSSNHSKRYESTSFAIFLTALILLFVCIVVAKG